MEVERRNNDHYTDILIYVDEGRSPWYAYRITCMDFDIMDGTRVPPTAHIALLSSTSATFEQARRLAAEYAAVADIAEALQAELRAAYDAREL